VRIMPVKRIPAVRSQIMPMPCTSPCKRWL
jgi:hypothetical protein